MGVHTSPTFLVEHIGPGKGLELVNVRESLLRHLKVLPGPLACCLLVKRSQLEPHLRLSSLPSAAFN